MKRASDVAEGQKKCSSVSDFPACCVVRVAGALWCVVVYGYFLDIN